MLGKRGVTENIYTR